MRLNRATLDRIPAAIPAPRNRTAVEVGIVHFGPGAFHRAHQASYIDTLLDDDPRWGIAAVSMRSAGTVRALAAQDGLYTLAVRDTEPSMRVIGAHQRFLGPGDAAETAALLADPRVRLVTTTVTEKGYCLRADGTLDFDHPDIVHDLTGASPSSVVGWIVAGLGARMAAGIDPFVPMPCDNLASNGAKLKAALIAFAGRRDLRLAEWIADRVRVPSTMVDSITPATDDRLLADVVAATGLTDEAPVQRESFVQWVIENIDDPAVAAMGRVGATLTGNVAAYEQAKLRILNGAHSTLAYLGLPRGHRTVAQAMGDAPLADFVARMIADEIIPTLKPTPGMDLDAYARAVLARFRNPAIEHRLDQIAQDGSQKIPYRLGDSLKESRRLGRVPVGIIHAIAGWLAFVIERAAYDTGIIDPMANRLAAIVSGTDPEHAVRAIISELNIANSECYDEIHLISEAVRDMLDRRWDVILDQNCASAACN